MVKPEWGAKHGCPKCGTRFYDLGKDDPVALALQFLLLPLQVWYLLVLARIVRLAIDSTLLAGMAIAVGYALASFLVQVELPRALAG